VKNSLFGRAADAAGKALLAPMLGGPTAVATGSADDVDLAKSLVDELRGLKALRIVGALISGRAMSAEDVLALARLPSRLQLQATLVGTLQAPLSGVVGVLTGAHSQLIRVFAAKGAQ
jgi:large subunit ribosomal protein L10